jgi:hypothetical protein
MFDTELAYFIKNQDELVRRFKGTVLVIRGNEIAGAYKTPMEAYLAAKEQYAPGTYMLQPCEPGPGAYTVLIGADANI